MGILYRPARLEDLENADRLVVATINDLTERHGFGRMAQTRPPALQRFSLNDDPDGLWIAEEDSAIVGFAWSWVCGDLWFLAQLFVAPGRQASGIGNALLHRAFAHAHKAQATSQALITFAFNRVSQALYMRHGLFPRLPINFFSVSRETLLARPAASVLTSKRIDGSRSDLQKLAEIDAGTIGVSRLKHHRFLMQESATRGYLLYGAGDIPAAYVYVNNEGHVGPVAVASGNDCGAVFDTATTLAAESGAANVSAFIPGIAEAALTVALQKGMRITFPMVLVSNRSFGDWSRYLPRNPGLM